MSRRTVIAAKVADIEKRRFPSKHYVYVIEVTWSDNSVNVVYRRYSQFFDLQCKLLNKFEYEAGSVDPSDRTIPFIPGKILFGRSQIREVAMRRKQPLNDYCQALIRLPVKISECQEILDFFETTPDDINPSLSRKTKTVIKGEKISAPRQLEQYVAIADYEREQSNEVSLTAGMSVEIIEKNENGWWFVSVDEEQGWVPSTFLEREDGSEEKGVVKAEPGKEEKYLCTQGYDPELSDEIQLERGVIVDVVEKNLEGWWLIRSRDKEGWAPAAYLQRVGTTRRDRLEKAQPSHPIQTITNMMEISTLNKTNSDQSASSAHQDALTNRDSHNKFEHAKGHDNVAMASEPLVSGVNRMKRFDVKSSPQLGGKKQPVPRKQSVKRKPARPPPPNRKSLYRTTSKFTDKIPNALNVQKNEEVEVIEKNQSGWWYVKKGFDEGWVPSSKLIRISDQEMASHELESVAVGNRPAQELSNQLKTATNHSIAISTRSQASHEQSVFVAVADFHTKESGELSLLEGQEVVVMDHNQNGWWLVRCGQAQGWAPSSYLREVSCPIYSNLEVEQHFTAKEETERKLIPVKDDRSSSQNVTHSKNKQAIEITPNEDGKFDFRSVLKSAGAARKPPVLSKKPK